jgi:alkanesulfonate monooxygenase
VKFKQSGGEVSQRKHAEDEGRNRLLRLAQDSEVHDDCLWTGVTAALGGLGSTTSLVGTPERVMRALQRYVDLGVDTFLVTPGSGFNWDASLTPFVELMRAQLAPASAVSASVA